MSTPIIMSIILGVSVVSLIIRSEIKIKRWTNAFKLHHAMFEKYLELTGDPLMSRHKLKEWLPIFEEVDKICARDCPNVEFAPLAAMIRSIINKGETIED